MSPRFDYPLYLSSPPPPPTDIHRNFLFITQNGGKEKEEQEEEGGETGGEGERDEGQERVYVEEWLGEGEYSFSVPSLLLGALKGVRGELTAELTKRYCDFLIARRKNEV